MTIAEFVKGRSVDTQAVRKFIERHPDDFKGHTGKKGREITLDEVALEILEGKYPLPQMVQVVEDKETIKKLIRLQEEYIKLQAKVTDQAMLIAQAEAQKILLEDKERQLEDKEQQLDQERKRAERAEQELSQFKPSWFGLYRKEK